MNDGRKNFFADQLGHACSGGYVAGGERGKASGVHVADLAVEGDRLAVAVNQEYGSSGTFDAQACENTFNSLELAFLYDKGRFCHLVFSLEKLTRVRVAVVKFAGNAGGQVKATYRN